MAKWKCDACGEAENADASCIVEMWAGEPERCPITGEECEWYLDKRLEDRIKELEKKIIDIATYANGLKSAKEFLLKQIKELEAELEDWENSAKFILGDDCPTDEVHCGCVVILKKRIKELEVALYNIAYKMAGSSKSKKMAEQALKG